MKMHYAGALDIQRTDGSITHILAGFAACCSGDRTRKIRAQGNHTYNPSDVTCVRCQKLLTDSASRDVTPTASDPNA